MSQPSPQTKRQVAVISARNKELDEREANIVVREKKLPELEIKIRVLNLRRGQAEKKLTNLTEQLDRLERTISEKQRFIEEYNDKLAEQAELAQNGKYKLNEDLKSLREEKKKLLEELEERKHYLKEQEVVIDDTLTKANEQFNQINYDIDNLYKRKDTELIQLREFEQRRESLSNEIETLEKKSLQLQQLYDTNAKNLRQSLDDLKDQIGVSSIQYQELTERSKTMIGKLASKEKELNEKDLILNERESRLSENERTLESKRRLYASV